MRRLLIGLLLGFGFIFFLNFSKYNNQRSEIDLVQIIPLLNEKQFNEVKKISVKDKQGFKFVINELANKKFTKFITTTSKQKVTKEDEKKITEIIKKYR